MLSLVDNWIVFHFVSTYFVCFILNPLRCGWLLPFVDRSIFVLFIFLLFFKIHSIVILHLVEVLLAITSYKLKLHRSCTCSHNLEWNCVCMCVDNSSPCMTNVTLDALGIDAYIQVSLCCKTIANVCAHLFYAFIPFRLY